MKKRGPKPRPVYVDGVYFPSIIAARLELKAMTGKRQQEFSQALKDGTPYYGRTLSYSPPGMKEVKRKMFIRERGAALLRGLVTHRL